MSCDITITDSSGIEIIQIAIQGLPGPQGDEGPAGPAAGPWDDATDYPVDGVSAKDGGLAISLQTPNVNQDPTPEYPEGSFWRFLLRALGGVATGLTQIGGIENVTTVASAATMTLDVDVGPVHVMSPQDENTTLALSNAATGKSASADLLQGAGGGFTISVPGSWKPYITPSPTVVAGEWNHVEVWQVGAVVFYTLKGQA